MKTFGTVYPFVETGDVNLRLGRHVANYAFLKALLRADRFEEYHLFCLSAGHLRATAERIRGEDIPDSAKRKVRVFLIHHLVDNLRSNRYHVFHLGGWGYFFPGLVYLRNTHARFRFPITGLIHSLNGIETPYHGLKLCTAPLLPFDTVVCSSKAGEAVLRASLDRLSREMACTGTRIAFAGRTETIPLGVDDRFGQTLDRDRCRARMGLPRTASIILSVGRLSPRTKGDPYPVLRSFRMLVDRNPGRELLLVMAGGATDSEKTLVGTMAGELGLGVSVKIVADFEASLKQELYGAADVFVALSDNLQETFGISIIEAMAAGIPVVASDLNGYKELFQEGVEGFRIPTTWLGELGLCELADIMNFETMQLVLAQCMAVDTEAAAGRMQELLDDTGLRGRMGEAGRERVRERYRWSTVQGRYERLWDRLAAEAEGYDGPVRAGENPFANNYLDTFGHYPTAVLTDEHRCSLTDPGRAALGGGRLPSPYADVAPLVDARHVRAMLQRLAGGEKCVRELIDDPEWAAVGKDRVRYALLWAAKYSLVRFDLPGNQ